ncbi:structural protein [uncultured Caudovirales phage]|uniref:Structural protein n=1 Tax=uncultured Caudovirales phage TaxID=2100421 RepID=A0A6J5L294_9CAUD|nr:structural protein [uncultured Caudovirales phage]CAB4134450.1 structural protein [uncultured Caudovirales phage]
MTKRAGCIATARAALNLFTDQELEDYLEKVSSRSRELNRDGVPFARQAAMKEINQEHLAALLDDSARAGRNITKFEILESKINRDITPDAFLDKTAKNTDHNVETANNAETELLNQDSFGTFDKEQMNMLEVAEIDDSVYLVADGGAHHDAKISAIGKVLNYYIDRRNAKLIKSDAMRPSEINQDRFFKTFYDTSKMVAMGKEKWVALMKTIVDLEGTFKNTKDAIIDGKINEALIDQKIGNTYDNITQGNGALFTKSTVARDMERVERTRHMFYKYKDWKSWGIGNKAFGQGSLFKAWLLDIKTSGNQIGMAQIFGSAPRMMWNEIRKLYVAKNPEMSFLQNQNYKNAESLFNNLLGANKGVLNPTIANFTGGILAATSMARLGLIVGRSFSDISNIAGINMRAGVGFWKPQLDALVNAFNLMPNAARKNLARTLSSSTNHQLAAIMRGAEVTGFGATLNKMSNKFFYRLGLENFDKGNRFSAMAPAMERYGKDSSKSFERLNRQQQSYLNRFNISPVEWDGLRAKTVDKLFSTDNVTNMTESELKDLWNKTDKIIPLSDYRSSLYRKVFSFFDTLQEFSVLSPTAWTNMMTTGNTIAGTPENAIMRILLQFKSFPLQTLRRVFIGGMQDMDGYQAKAMYALNMTLSIIGLTTLSDALLSISKGYTPADPRNMSKGEAANYYLKMVAGGLGAFSSIMNDGTNSKQLASSLFATPSWKLLVSPITTATSLLNGDLKGARNNARDFANNANPFATAPVVSPFIDAMLGNKPYLEPGQHSLF